MTKTLDSEALLAILDEHRLVDRFEFAPILDLATGEEVQAGIVAARIERGERQIGYKIGFTNRTIWPLYGVYEPIWGPIYDTTVTLLDGIEARLDPTRFILPRLEPEIVFRVHAAPASAELGDVAAAIDWAAHGFEIVQSPFADWRFTAAESFAAQSLHGALLVGPRVPIGQLADSREQLVGLLSRFSIELSEGGEVVASGRGSDVLDSPLHALAHLVRQLGSRGLALSPGDIITTGALTDAQPLDSGQQWHTRLEGLGLAGLTLKVGS